MHDFLGEELKRCRKKGEFRLSSGLVLDSYFDVKEILGDPEALNAIADELYKLFPKGVTCVASSGYGGLKISAVVGSRHGLKMCEVRKEQKNYGMKKMVEGYRPGADDIVAVVDDVSTTGKSLYDTACALSPARIAGLYTVIDRRIDRGNEIVSIFREIDLL